MSTTLTSVRTLAVGVALMLGAAGCSSSSDSDAPNSAVSTAGASNSSSAAYVFDVVNFAWTEPAAGAIASLKRSDCEFCDKLEDYAGVLSASQRRFESDPFTVEAPIALKAKNTFRVFGRANKVDIIDKSGKTVSTFAGSGIAFTVAVKWSGKRWMVDSLTQG